MVFHRWSRLRLTSSITDHETQFLPYCAVAVQLSEVAKEADAAVLADTVDRERTAFIKEYFHAEWPNRSVYHAMLNAAAGEDTVINAILSFLDQSRSRNLAAD